MRKRTDARSGQQRQRRLRIGRLHRIQLTPGLFGNALAHGKGPCYLQGEVLLLLPALPTEEERPAPPTRVVVSLVTARCRAQP